MEMLSIRNGTAEFWLTKSARLCRISGDLMCGNSVANSKLSRKMKEFLVHTYPPVGLFEKFSNEICWHTKKIDIAGAFEVNKS